MFPRLALFAIDSVYVFSYMQVYKCPLGTMAMWNVTKHHLAQLPMPDILGGKAGWYKNLIFSVGNLDTAYQPAHQYEQVRAAQTRAGIRKNGVVCHLPRHASAFQARAMYSEAAGEVAIAGGWQKSQMQGVYCQVPSGDSLARRAGYSAGRAGAANFRQIISPLSFVETAPMIEEFPGLCEQLDLLRQASHFIGTCSMT